MFYRTIDILGIPLTKIDRNDLINIIDYYIQKNIETSIFPVNVDMVVKAKKDADFLNVLKKSSVLIADGMPIVWISKLLKDSLPEKLSGSSLFFDLCELSNRSGYRIFFLGAAEGVANKASILLKKKYPNLKISGTYSPPFGFETDVLENTKIINLLIDSKPDILFVALGAPKQEKWIINHMNEYKISVSIAIGATLDFVIGNKKIPPDFIKRIGLAWLWRLIDEPKRLWRRYLIDDMKFFYYVYKEILKKK